ncbi:hypothetical protein FUAX_40070 (plasmid) [Fulvitalea axinellae]|uniref:Uncharacterized protein n=1 Tax=Fulvitalea axinellae TaxID=1182444 RepID=A0AAU9DK05_9BACT|nr:hypothetical protein FUAX_40070 [Fulvitalea axinellae]
MAIMATYGFYSHQYEKSYYDKYICNFKLSLTGIVIGKNGIPIGNKAWLIIDVKESNYQDYDERDSIEYVSAILKGKSAIVQCQVSSDYKFGDSIILKSRACQPPLLENYRNGQLVKSTWVALSFNNYLKQKTIQELISIR